MLDPSALPAPDRLAEVAAGGPTPPGWSITYVASLDSTQDAARAASRQGAPGRSVFVVDYQAHGRGRLGRVWVAPPGTSLLLSILFRTTAPAMPPQHYTRLLAVALAEAIERVAPEVRPALKWPNDLLVGRRKLAGVLAEAAWRGGDVSVIVGVGVNVNLDAATLALASPTATSLAVEAGRPIDRGGLFLALLERLDAWEQRGGADLLAAWNARLWGRGQRLRVHDLEGVGDREVEAVVLGTRPDGALRLRLADGREVETTTAELIL